MDSECELVYKKITAFVDNLASKDDTWKFWYDIVFHDCLAYTVYLAIRDGSWSLHIP